MAVGTQEAKVRQTIVVPPSIEVIELEGDRKSIPLRPPTDLTARLLQAFSEEPRLQVDRVRETPFNQHLAQRSGGNRWPVIASFPALAHEVRRIGPQVDQAGPQPRLVPARSYPEPAENLSEGARYAHDFEKPGVLDSV